MTVRREPLRRAPARRPRLQVSWSGGWEDVRETLRALATPLPVLPPQAARVAFRGAALRSRWSGRTFLLSVLLHVLFLVMPLPEFLTRAPARASALRAFRIEYDLRWTGRSLVLPPVSPTPRPQPRPSPGGREDQALPPQGAEVAQRQTIVSDPPEPNHPRQTLLRQNALERARVRAPEVRLPNMVIPPAPNPAPELDLSRMRIPNAPLDLTEAPQAPMPPRPKSGAELALESARLENLLPRMTLPVSKQGDGTTPAPDVSTPGGVPRSGDLNLPGVLALSAQPAAPTPVMELPDSNLRARFVAGPYPGSGSPGGVPGGVLGAEGGRGGGLGGEAGGPGVLEAPDVLVMPAGEMPSGPVIIGPGTGSGPPVPPPAEPPQPAQAEAAAQVREEFPEKAPPERAEELLEGISPGTLPRAGSAHRRVYTVYINMPNLTSRTGSWVLRFAELGEASTTAPGGAADGFPLEAPVAVRKVDPRYPAAARRSGIEGSVYLYGIIRRDGTVDKVAVVRGLYEALDQSAVAAFRRWRFEPGRKNGEAVTLEVVVEIPFRLGRLF